MSGLVTKSQLESDYGPIQGQMVLGDYGVLIFETVQIKYHRETGVMNLIAVPSPVDGKITRGPSKSAVWRELKRKIARLPIHEQVRYWKLHQIRNPEQDVSSELEAALDKLDELREKARAEETEVVTVDEAYPHRNYRYRRTRTYIPFFPSFGYSSNYRYNRSLKRDAELELERYQRRTKPVEIFDSPMNLADRARSDALSKVSGARSGLLRNTR